MTMAHQMLGPADQKLGLPRTRPCDDDLVAVYVVEGPVPVVRLDSNVGCIHWTIVGSGSRREYLGLNHQNGFDTEHA
jgi:hypothetical protein